MIIEGTYSRLLVVLSICISTVAAYTALDLAGRVRNAVQLLFDGTNGTDP